MERKGWRKEIQRCLGCHQSKRQEVIDALIDGDVKGTAKYLGLKRKEDKPLRNQTRDIHKVSSWTVAAWEEMTKKVYVDGNRLGALFTREEMPF